MNRTTPFRFLVLTAVFLLAACDMAPAPPPPRLLSLNGEAIDPIAESSAAITVFLFTRTDCPISNRYAPEVRRLCEEFGPKGVEFFLVYPDPDVTSVDIRAHQEAFDYPCRAIRDPEHALVARTGATVTPEAAVFTGWRDLHYRGRIDNWYANFGESRKAATEHDLAEALNAVLEDRPVARPTTKAVGCYISDLK